VPYLEVKFSDGRDLQVDVADGQVKIELPLDGGPETRFFCLDGLFFANLTTNDPGKPPWTPGPLEQEV
jgi:hypothetical protein